MEFLSHPRGRESVLKRILGYAACINNLAALKVIAADGINVEPFKALRFPSEAESNSWISSQPHPQFYTTLPVVSLRDAAHAGSIYSGRSLREWQGAAAGEDLGSPEPMEGVSDAEASVCSARFFLDGGDFDVLEREVKAETGTTGHPESELFRWVRALCKSVYALFPSVTVEMLIVLFGSYQLHMEIERRADHLRRCWWALGWYTLTERKCRQITHRVQEYLNSQFDRLSLLLPHDHLLLCFDQSRFGDLPRPLKVETRRDIENSHMTEAPVGAAEIAPPTPPDNGLPRPLKVETRHDIENSHVTEAPVGAAEIAPPTPPDNGQDSPIATKTRKKGKSTRGPRRLFTDEELAKAGVLRNQGLTWLDITRQLRPGTKVDDRLHDKLADGFRHNQKRLQRNRATHPNNSSE
jgi:hypothetical protein